MKEIVQDLPPKRIKYLQFGVASPEEIAKQGVLEVNGRDLYTLENHSPAPNGALDTKMGTSDKQGECATCGKKMADCVGHFGYVKLALPAFHIGYFKHILTILQTICKSCGYVLLEETDRRAFLKSLRRPNIDNLTRSQVQKKVTDQAKKMRHCPRCQQIQGVVKKAGPLKIIHERFRYVRKAVEPEQIEFNDMMKEAFKANADLKAHASKAHDDLNPLRVLKLFRLISPVDSELLGIDPEKGQPETFLWQYLPAPPVCIRPSVAQDGASTEDDLTVKLAEITWTSGLIKNALDSGTPIVNLMEQWDYMQLLIAQYINSESPGIRNSEQISRPIRGFCQRLKGKQGRFRGNLSGKRVDFSGRTVISPDPNLRIDQVAVPERVAKILTYPERATRWNMSRLQKAIINGCDVWPGANYLIYTDSNGVEQRRFLKFGARQEIAANLRIGDVVERHLIDDDIVLFNRQPSLHKLSIMAHLAKIRPWRTFRLNECVCGSFNADFDGDEMNLHVPQTEEARTEALQLMGVKENLVTPKNGEPIVAATQDFITGAYLISQKDQFYNRRQFMQLCCMMTDGSTHIEYPPPAIVKPMELWTGKQVFSVLMRPNKSSPVLVNVEAKTRSFSKPDSHFPDLCERDGYLVIRNSEIMCGVVDKSNVGDGRKTSIFYVILRDYGAVEAAAAMNRLAKLCSRYLGNRGFSIGINDVQPGENLRKKKDSLVEKAYEISDDYILQLAKGTIETQPGMDQEQTLESKISSTLSKVRDDCGAICMSDLSKTNAALVMATCGSKGSQINVSQMVACVGQQIISGKRVPDGFQDRSLPHFPKNSKRPPSKGFVRNSFYSGLNPSEFFFHAISGREGLVDTAVKTAETGYMSRRLMKSLEDLSAQYDGTVRSANTGVVQFTYGDDGLDPTYLEGDGQPIEFHRTWTHAIFSTPPADSRRLLPYEIAEFTDIFLRSPLVTANCTPAFIDSVRAFVMEHVVGKLESLRSQKGLVSLAVRPQGDEYDGVDLDAFAPVEARNAVDNVMSVHENQIDTFLQLCWHKYLRAKVEPGTAVGAIGAQSIGEPGTQMTLKTFHFAGVAAMTTLGVPRIKEIINAAKVIQTPVITCKLAEENDVRSARVVKGRVEKTHLEDIALYIEDIYGPVGCYIGIKVDFATISKLQLEITMEDIVRAIIAAPKLHISPERVNIVGHDSIRVYVTEDDVDRDNTQVYYRVQHCKRMFPQIVIKGIPTTNRAIINQNADGTKQLLVEGYGLKDVMNTEGILGTHTSSNHITEVKAVLGIEAARACIIKEVDFTMASHGLDVDPRHLMLLGDVMTYKGDVLGITRFGVSKMKDSVLMLASFEKTTDHLFDAAARLSTDAIEGVSERIIMGIPMTIGTGIFRLIRHSGMEKRPSLKPLLFDV